MFQQISFAAAVEILTESNVIDVDRDENGRMGLKLQDGPFIIQRGDDNHLFLNTGACTPEQAATVEAEIKRIVPVLHEFITWKGNR